MKLPILSSSKILSGGSMTATSPNFCVARLPLVGSLLMIALVSACSSAGVPRSSAAETESDKFDMYAVEAVSSFSMVGGLDQWRSLGDEKLVVWTRLNRVYLLTVQPPCNELQFTTTLALTSNGGTVSKGSDGVIVESGKCLITDIRPIDYERLQQDERQKAANE